MDRVFALLAVLRRQSSGPARQRGAFEALKARRMKGCHPTPDGVVVARQPPGNFRTRVAIEQQQETMVPLT
jgi:hypothetical protein